MKSFRTAEYKILAYRLALVYLFYFLARIAFYSFNQAHLSVDGIADFLHLAFYGLLFDTTAIIYVNLLFIFLSVLPLLINTKPIFQKVLFWVYFICNIPAYLLNFIDIAYFSYNKTRLTTNDWALVENEHNPLTLLALLGAVLGYFCGLFSISSAMGIPLQKAPCERRKCNASKALLYHIGSGVGAIGAYAYFWYTWFLVQKRGDSTYCDGR